MQNLMYITFVWQTKFTKVYVEVAEKHIQPKYNSKKHMGRRIKQENCNKSCLGPNEKLEQNNWYIKIDLQGG